MVVVAIVEATPTNLNTIPTADKQGEQHEKHPESQTSTMDGEAPSWLEEPAAAAPEPTPAPTEAPPSAFSIDDTPEPTSKTTSSAPTDNVAGSILNSMNARAEAKEKASEVDESDLSRMILFMRVANLAAAGLLISCSIVELVSIPGIGVWILSIYAICGGALICCLETQLKFVRTAIAMNFGFLFHSVYRFIFYLLMASVVWFYQGVLGYITAGLLAGVAVFNTYILCRYPTYRRMREKIAEEEDKRIEAKIRKEVGRQAMSSVMGGR